MSEFRSLLREDSLDGWKIYPRGILRYTPGTEEYENAWAPAGTFPWRFMITTGWERRAGAKTRRRDSETSESGNCGRRTEA